MLLRTLFCGTPSTLRWRRRRLPKAPAGVPFHECVLSWSIPLGRGIGRVTLAGNHYVDLMMTKIRLDEERIFCVACKLSDVEVRREYLDQVCAGDQPLRERVEALLEIHEKERSFLKSECGVELTVDHKPITEVPGQQIGRYRLLQKIGEGGFGVVFMAEQVRPVRRKVALKVIKPGMDSNAVVARFEAERQALAMMDHPNIARVLDGGAADSGRPYFVMELVKGVPITEYCDKNQLSAGERLKLFLTVCQAVQHAHQKGIIHRDLKPSNVLVTLADGQPVVKVIDFGVAKATNQQLTERTLFTAYGQILGTPQYMSPEQAEMSCLDVDTRSDVYSLGVILYELLTGTTPLESDRLRSVGYVEMQRLIREEEPLKPSARLSTSGDELTIIAKHRSASPDKLTSQIRGDLDWIVMKALEKDRNRRYATCSSFADDVSRYLSDLPVEACPPSSTYRFKKFARRNRVILSTAAAVSAVLLLATMASSWFAWEAAAQRNAVLHETQEQTMIFALQGDTAKADEKLAIAQQLGADEGWLKMQEAHLLYHKGEYENALAVIDKAAALMPDSIAVKSLDLICNYMAGNEHQYLREAGKIKDLPVSTAEGYLFRGLAQPEAHPRRAVEDLEKALPQYSQYPVVHLLLANALRLSAADTVNFGEAYRLAKRAVGEAFIAKEMLKEDPLGSVEYIHANVLLANLCKRLGKDDWECELYTENARKCVEVSKSQPYHWKAHLARMYFHEQLGDNQDDKEELFIDYPELKGNQRNSDIFLRRAWQCIYDNDLLRAERELQSVEGSFAYRTNLLVPAFIAMNKSSADLVKLQWEFKPKLENREGGGRGDLCASRLGTCPVA